MLEYQLESQYSDSSLLKALEKTVEDAQTWASATRIGDQAGVLGSGCSSHLGNEPRPLSLPFKEIK